MAAGLLGAAALLLLAGVVLWTAWRSVQHTSGGEQLLAAACLGGLVAHGVQAQPNPDWRRFRRSSGVWQGWEVREKVNKGPNEPESRRVCANPAAFWFCLIS